MTHDSYRELIQRELDDDLSSEELALLEAHVTTCAECQREREEFDELAFGLSRLSKLMPERSFVAQIPSDVLPELPPESQKQPTRRISPLLWRGLSVAAVVVLAIGWSTQWKFGQGSHVAGLHPNNPASTLTALLPDSSTAPGQPVTPDPQSTSSSSAANGTKPTEKQGTSSILQNVTTLLKQSLLGASAPEADASKLSSGTTTKPSAPPLLADASNGSSTQTTQPGNTDPVITNPVSKNNSSGAGTTTDSNDGGNGTVDPSQSAGNGTGTVTDPGSGSGSGSGTTTTPTNGTDPTPTPTPDPTPAPPPPPVVKGPTTTGGGGFKPSLNGGQSVQPTGNVIGSLSSMTNLFTVSLQKQADNGVDSAQWALDPVQVVQHCLSVLGFSSDSSVMATNSLSRVQVVQDGIQYEVALFQPYEQGVSGIWVPQQIGRAIDENHPSSSEQPIVDYFDMITTSGKIQAHQTIYIVNNSNPRRVVVTVEEQHVSASGAWQWVNVKYVFKLKQTSANIWVLDGNPTALYSSS